MPEHEERDHDGLRGQVRQLTKVVNDQVKRNAQLEKRVAKVEAEVTQMREAPIIEALDRITKAVRESKGDWTADEEKKISDKVDTVDKRLGQKPPDPVPA